MNITLVMVETLDGKTTWWREPVVHGWSSPEDQTHFAHLKENYNLLVMGRKTYETVRNAIVPSPRLLRVVMTQKPEDFSREAVAGQIEFTNESPDALVQKLSARGFTSMLLVGGSEVNEAFLKKQLITTCMITLEPRFFGTGKGIFAETNVDIPLQLIRTTQLNDQGTLLLEYTVLYDHPNH